MKHCVLLLFLLLAAFAASGADETTSVNVKEDARKAAANLRQLTRQQREAAIAEIRGLLFMPDDSSAYSSKTGSDKVEVKQGGKSKGKTTVPYRNVRQGAQFIGTDGKLYDFYAAQRSAGSSARKKEAWKQAKLYIYRAGQKAAFSAFEDELTALEVQRSIYFLQQMSPELRASMFAEVLGLLYLDNGQDPYTGKTLYNTISGEKVPYQECRNGVRFVDAQGVSHTMVEAREVEKSQGKPWRTWWFGVKLGIHRVGHEAIFAPFEAEIQAMREHASGKVAP